MDITTFKLLHSETIMYYQRIEYDLKLIYAFMRKGNVTNHLEMNETKTLGQMINILKELDQSDGKPLISSDDYNFLSQICENRNLWAHHAYTDFLYVNDCLNSKEYKKQCEKLLKDHARVEQASINLEKIRIGYCSTR